MLIIVVILTNVSCTNGSIISVGVNCIDSLKYIQDLGLKGQTPVKSKCWFVSCPCSCRVKGYKKSTTTLRLGLEIS